MSGKSADRTSKTEPVYVAGDSVIVPRAEWERTKAAAERAEEMRALREEDAADLAAAQTARERLAAGDEEWVPADHVKRIMSGESPVRVWREYRGLSGTALARRAGIDQSYVSNIETGKRQGTLTVHLRIDKALGVELESLVPVERP